MNRFILWWKTDKRYVKLIKAVLMAVLPVFCCVVSCALEGKAIGQVYLPSGEWNDELFYFKQVEGMIEFGYPQGYFGFNESHALKLSFAAWSPVLVFPWVLWGLVFGWNLLSPVICNILLLTLAVFWFVWLVKPTWKQLGILTLLFCLYTPFVRYMLSGMPEIICFSLLIIFYGLAVAYLKKESVAKLIWMFLITGLLTLMRPYMLLFLLLPMFFWVRKKKWIGVAGSVAVAAVIGVIYVLIKHYLGAEYFTPLFYTDWVTTFFEKGFAAGVHNFFSRLYWKGLEFMNHTKRGVRDGLASGAFFSGYLIMMAVLVLQSFADWRRYRKEKASGAACKETENRFIIDAHIAFSFVAMLFALLLMYKMTEGSKHFLTFMAAGLFVISLMETKFYKKAAIIGLTFAYFYSYMAVEPYDYQVPYVEETRQAQVEYWQDIFTEQLSLREENVPNYDNAIIWTFSDTTPEGGVIFKWQLLYGLPKGFGISCCEPDYIVENFENLHNRYIATVSDGVIDVMCRDAGYREIGRDADMVVYERY